MPSENLNNIQKDKLMRDSYRSWKLEALDEAGYFIIFQGFLQSDKLKEISGNALKLYIYLGLNANNFDGKVWHSNEKIAKYFNRSERTIRLWMNELENIGLIKRMRLKYNGIVFTYLIPYKYKISTERDEAFIGYLYIDELNSLNIENDDLSIPITNSTDIEIFDDKNNEWIDGKIEIRRPNFMGDKFDENLKYIFKSKNKTLMFEINKEKVYKIRILLQ